MKQLPLILIILLGPILFHNCAGPESGNEESTANGKDLDEIGLISERIKKDTLNAGLYHERARLFLERKRINEALGDLGEAIELDPENPAYFLTLGGAYLAMGQMPNCLEALQTAEKLDPSNNEALLKLAEVYLILKDYESTFNYIKKALLLDTRNPRAYFIRGYALMEMGDTSAAIRNMQNALDQDQQYYDAAVQLGLLFSEKEDPLAEQYYKTAISIDPNREAAYYLLGLFSQDAGKMEDAINAYSRLLTVNPGFKEASYNIGYIYLVHYEDFPRAIEHFSQAIRQDPKYLDAYFNRGYSYELSGDYPNARRDYEKSLEIQPNYSRAVEGLNRLDLIMGN